LFEVEVLKHLEHDVLDDIDPVDLKVQLAVLLFQVQFSLLVGRLSYLEGILQLVPIVPIHKVVEIFAAPTVARVVLQASSEDLDPLARGLDLVRHQDQLVVQIKDFTPNIPLSHLVVGIQP
jgi:hypothetical protein